ncbi:MAG: 50S ribosomal protein L25 [Vicinamibacteria bacterium]|nr:50S ribosomal protein L25 [Vicinamibacteria bacterium]
MPEVVVTAESRSETGKNANRRLRQKGFVPAVFYGARQEAVSLAVSKRELIPVMRGAEHRTSLFDLELAGQRRKVIIKETQIEPIHGFPLHVDFYEVALDKPLELSVHVELTGTPVGVKTQGGILDFITRDIDIECLPMDIPEKIVVDVSELEIGKHLRVSDLTPPQGVRFVTEPGVVVAHVVERREEAAPAAEEAVAAEAGAEAAGAAEPEVIKKGKTGAEQATADEEK